MMQKMACKRKNSQHQEGLEAEFPIAFQGQAEASQKPAAQKPAIIPAYSSFPRLARGRQTT